MNNLQRKMTDSLKHVLLAFLICILSTSHLSSPQSEYLFVCLVQGAKRHKKKKIKAHRAVQSRCVFFHNVGYAAVTNLECVLISLSHSSPRYHRSSPSTQRGRAQLRPRVHTHTKKNPSRRCSLASHFLWTHANTTALGPKRVINTLRRFAAQAGSVKKK